MEIKVLKNILGVNEQIAKENRGLLDSKGIFALNIMSSPGAGKTSLILETIRKLDSEFKIGVIEGDIASSIDAEKIGAKGIPVIQINTGGACHLDANMVSSALKNLPLDTIKLLFIENVGNLICPGEFELGEHKKVILLSTPEGDDKPYKYPLLFRIADVVVVSKTDLLPYLNFNMDNFVKAVRTINQKAPIIPLSAVKGLGLGDWFSWLKGVLTGGKRNA